MLLFNKCIPEEVCGAMRLLEVNCTDVRREGLSTSTDETLVAVARRLGAMFVTLDLDFTARALMAAMAAAGICVVLLRPPKGYDLAQLAEIILKHMRGWAGLCGTEPTIISCNLRGSRARPLGDILHGTAVDLAS